MENRNEIKLEQHSIGEYIPYQVPTAAGPLYKLGLVVAAKPSKPDVLKLIDLPVASMDQEEIKALAAMRALEWGGAVSQ